MPEKNPVLSHLLELRAVITTKMRAKGTPVAIYNECRDRVRELDATLIDLGYDVQREVADAAPSIANRPRPSRKQKRNAGQRGNYAKRLQSAFIVKRLTQGAK